MVARCETVTRSVHPCAFIYAGDADRVAGLASDLRRVQAHGSAVAFAERVNGIQLVHMVAQVIEKLFPFQAAKVVLFAKLFEHGVESIGDIGGDRKSTGLKSSN